MTRAQLVQAIFEKKSYLCVGLDTDRSKLPASLSREKDGMLRFNKAIIDATRDHCVAYKINTAFYEAEGLEGWRVMEETANYIGTGHLRIADAKRGDIGNTSSMYARAFFEQMDFDALTVAPYMGEDSLKPFLEYKNKWTIVLGLTSNPGSADFQRRELKSGNLLYTEVIEKIMQWGDPGNLMFVVGATQSADFDSIRKLAPDHFFLVPGVGAQGGSLEDVSTRAMNKDCGLLVNASRAIIYASANDDFAAVAEEKAIAYKQQMKSLLKI